MIPTVSPITVKPRLLTDRLWDLHKKCIEGTATPHELTELEAMCAALDAGQDNQEEAE